MAAHTAPAHPHASEHAHPTPGTYFKIAVVLFILTAFEVLTFEAGRGGLRATPRPHLAPGPFFKVAVVVFILTAFEVLPFEGGRGGLGPTLRPIFEPIVVLVLVVFSGAKFVLVAMFYMHLKQDPRLLSNLFAFPLTIAAIIIAALIVLFRYWRMMGAL